MQKKVYKSLQKTYQDALDRVIVDRLAFGEMETTEAFVKKWMEDSLDRSWYALQDPERFLSEDYTVKLFKTLMVPFGPSHPSVACHRSCHGNMGHLLDTGPSSGLPFGLPSADGRCSQTLTVRRQNGGEDHDEAPAPTQGT